MLASNVRGHLVYRFLHMWLFVCCALLLAVAGCGSSDADYGKPGDSTLPEAKPYGGTPAQQPMPDRKAP